MNPLVKNRRPRGLTRSASVTDGACFDDASGGAEAVENLERRRTDGGEPSILLEFSLGYGRMAREYCPTVSIQTILLGGGWCRRAIRRV